MKNLVFGLVFSLLLGTPIVSQNAFAETFSATCQGTGNISLTAPGVGFRSVSLDGMIEFIYEIGPNGEVPPLPDPESIPIEIVSMSLSGVDPQLGPVMVSTSAAPPTLGSIIEIPPAPTDGILDVAPFAPGLVDFFIDGYFDIEFGSSLFQTNLLPVFGVGDEVPELAWDWVGSIILTSPGTGISNVVLSEFNALFVDCPDFQVSTISGNTIPIESLALLLAGINSSLMFIVPVIGASIAFGIYKFRRN